MNTRIINKPSYPSNGESPDIRHDILTNELGNQMLDMVAPIYDRSKVALYLFQAFGETLEPAVEFIWNDMVAQMYPQTATWGLDYWEERYGIITDKSKTIEQRRASFVSNSYRPPMTPKRIEHIVSSLTGLECEVTENVAPNTFNVTVHGPYPNVKSIRDTLDKMTPAHLIYTIKVVETLETTTSETYPVATGNYTERLGKAVIADYTREPEKMAAATADVFQAIASGNIVERFGEIEVIN